jgi:adenosylhomocysteine nucleosidase
VDLKFPPLFDNMIYMKKPSRIGIIIPTNLELQPFLKLIPALKLEAKHPWEVYNAAVNGTDIRIIISYIGPANAAAATERLCDFAPQIVLHGGSAGAINKELMPGDVVIGKYYKPLCSREILEVRKTLLLSNKGVRFTRQGEGVHLEQLETAAELLQMAAAAAKPAVTGFSSWDKGGWPSSIPPRIARVIQGTVGSQDGWTKDLAELDFLHSEFGVDCEDMESAFVAQIAAKHDLPFLAVRGISNNEYVATLQKDQIFPAVRAAAERAAIILYSVIQNLTNMACSELPIS